MSISAVFSPPLTPPPTPSALVQAGKVEQNAANGLASASNDVLPSIQGIAASADQTSRHDSSVMSAVNAAIQQATPARPAQLNFANHGEIAPATKG